MRDDSGNGARTCRVYMPRERFGAEKNGARTKTEKKKNGKIDRLLTTGSNGGRCSEGTLAASGADSAERKYARANVCTTAFNKRTFQNKI